MNNDDPKDDEMPPKRDIPADGLNEILAWLDEDPERAEVLYMDLRRHLIKIFAWNCCTDPEWMADETFDRVARKVHNVRPTFKGDPAPYFYSVANNLIKEYRKNVKLFIPIEDVDQSELLQAEEREAAVPEVASECLDNCLGNVSSEDRELLIEYYAKEKQAKIDLRKELAIRLGVPIGTLRVRMFRLRASLEDCIRRCIEQQDPNEMD